MFFAGQKPQAKADRAYPEPTELPCSLGTKWAWAPHQLQGGS